MPPNPEVVIEKPQRLRAAAELIGGTLITTTVAYLGAKGVDLNYEEAGQEISAATPIAVGVGIGSFMSGTIIQFARYGSERNTSKFQMTFSRKF